MSTSEFIHQAGLLGLAQLLLFLQGLLIHSVLYIYNPGSQPDDILEFGDGLNQLDLNCIIRRLPRGQAHE